MIDLIGILKSVQAKKARSNSPIAKAGFTLIELSIVLVIIGLLVGGILTGQSLIRAAEIRSVISDTDKYKTAYNTFKGKYNCIPGDCINATDFFGAQTTPDAACAALTTPSTGTLTCNGNGNGMIGEPLYHEIFRFWQHLSNAGLINGKYTGVSSSRGSADHDHILGLNAPNASISGSGYSISYYPSITGNTYIYDGNYGNLFTFGKENAGTFPYNGIFTPAEAQAFDAKIYDGKPATGLVMMRSVSPNQVFYIWGDNNACTTSTSQTDYAGVYNTASHVIACSMIIKTGIY